jgi:hypothetical protein
MTVRGDLEAFTWPDHRGHSVEFLSGANAGVYPILEILDPVYLTNIEEPPENPNDGGSFVLGIELDANDSGKFLYIGGENAGVQQIVGINLSLLGPITWTFDAASIVTLELRRGPNTVKAKGEIRLKNLSDDSVIARIRAGETSYGRPSVTAEAATWTSKALQAGKFKSNVVRLDAAGGVPAKPLGFDEEEDVPWRIVPTFPVDAGIPFELVDAGSVAAATLTTRQDINALFGLTTGELMAVGRTTVLSAQTLDEKERIELAAGGSPVPPRDLTHYAFWLFDDFGFIRELARDTLTVAGVISDQDSFFRDETGAHIIP